LRDTLSDVRCEEGSRDPAWAATTLRLARRAAALGVALTLSTGCAEDVPPKPSAAAPQLLAGPGGRFVAVDSHAFRIAVHDGEGRIIAEQSPLGFRFTAGGRERRLGPLVGSFRRPEQLEVEVSTELGNARVRLEWLGDRALAFEFTPPREVEVASFCEAWVLAPDEAIYGLTERAADGVSFFGGPPMNELIPGAEGSLDRRGETIEMYVRPSVAIYAPLYHSTRGYGHFVRGTMPGRYDVGASDPQALELCFEGETAPGVDRFRSVIFLGSPAEIVDAYTELTGRPLVPPAWAFRHWRWRDELAVGAPARLDGVALNAQLVEDLRMYERFGIPAGVYLIDRPWSPGEFGFESFHWDEERLPNPQAMVDALAARGWKLAVWSAAFAVGENLEEAKRRGFLAPGSDLIVDLTNPEARHWWKARHVEFARRWGVAAWKLDRGEEELPSDVDDVWADGRSGRAVHNDYPRLQAEVYAETLREARGGGDFAVLMRAGYSGAQRHGIVWGGDITGSHFLGYGPGTDLGLRSAILAQLRVGFLGYPFWGSDTGGYYEFKDREVFARWLEFSAFSAIMEIGGHGAHAPWAMPSEPRFDEELIEIYRRYVRLHHDLIPYIVNHAQGRARRGLPVARALAFDFPDDPNVRDLWDEYLFGPDLLVAPVWETGRRERDVYLPAGRWEDFWDRSRTWEGPLTIRVEVPLDAIPVFVRAGMQVPGRPGS
jgi:alpha-glucosidase (family GH31 glycosyl hydrolase)